ncbi:TerC family protein [Thalassoglobus sp.]|uniref:TerC family protein n=1 Tax=Thalassoglobus sp. TaxID=2795869 RepID=UPI003AA92726
MADLFTIGNFMTLLMLILLQAVLGFDNLLYISIESKRVPEDKQRYVRKLGIGLAIGLRILLLIIVVQMLESFKDPFFEIHIKKVFEGEFNLHALITIAGGGFILYTAVKEINHMLAIEHLEEHQSDAKRSVNGAIFWIVLMNLVFSFDSILSAMALTDNTIVMAVAIIVSGLLMIFLADHVAEFLKKNRMYEVLGLFILFIVGVMLISEGGHLAHIKLFSYEVHAMTKTTFYFVLAVLVIVDIVQSRYQKKIALMRELASSKTAKH